MKLTDMACKSAKPAEKPYKRFDGGGLYLYVTPQGSKLWRIKYRILGRERRLSLGAYPIKSLAEAREDRFEIKKLLQKGIDPADVKKEEKRQLVRNATNTFKAVALEWMEVNEGSWTAGYGKKIARRLEMHVFPHIGNRPITQINPPELLECLRHVEKAGALDMAGRAKQVCGQIFRYAIQTGRCERDPSADLRGALKVARTEHLRTLPLEMLPDFMKALERNEARLFERTRRAIWLSLYTFCRPGEIRQARWNNINLQMAQWTIPGAMMKSGRDHIVPLSAQSLRVLQEQFEETGNDRSGYVFPSQVKRNHPMSDGTVNRAIQNLGFGKDLVAHGFRALARTTIREQLEVDSEIIEKQLAHATKNPLGEAYDRTQFLKQRKKMMQEWADYLDTLPADDKVVKTNFKKKAA